MIGVGIGPGLAARGGFSPASLFANGEQGAWYDVRPGYVYQDAAATTPAGVGDPVGHLVDRSGNGNNATQSTAGARPVLRQSGSLYYLEFDGVDDRLEFTNPCTGAEDHTFCYSGLGATSTESILSLGASGSAYATRSFSTEISLRITGGVEVYDVSNTDLAVVSHVLSGTLATDNRAWRNGLELNVASSAAGSTMNTATVGRIGYNSSYGYGDVDIYSMVVIDRAVTSSEREDLESCVGKQAGIARFYDTLMLFGQSNMAGRAPYDSLGGHAPNTYEWTQAGALAVAGVPLEHPGMNSANMGLDVSLSSAWSSGQGGNLLFVPHAEGSTGFTDNDWNQVDTLYNTAVGRANAALATPGARLRGIMWLQGEQDSLSAYSTTEASHAADIDAMIGAMRSDISGATNAPFVLGQIPNISGTFFDKQALVRAAIEDTPNRVTKAAFANNTDLTKLGDGLHYDAASLRIMGARMYTALATLL